MKKMSLHIYIAIGVFLILVIIGSFVDLQLSQAIFSKDDSFGIAVAALSMNFGYVVIAFMGGVVGYHAFALSKVTYQRILIGILSLAFLAIAVYFDGGEFFGDNGWYNPKIEYVGYFIAFPIMASAYLLGVYSGKKANNPRLWILMTLGAFFIGLSLVVGTTVVKSIFHRPRYRTLVSGGWIEFYPWWKRCENYKVLMEEFGKEEFKSFPSGHTSVCAMTMFGVVILPFVLGKEVKHQVLYFYLAMAYTLFVAFTRVLVGAHFLSDVGMGGLITLVCLYIYYSLVIHYPQLYKAPQPEAKEE